MQEQGCQTGLSVWYILHFAKAKKKQNTAWRDLKIIRDFSKKIKTVSKVNY